MTSNKYMLQRGEAEEVWSIKFLLSSNLLQMLLYVFHHFPTSLVGEKSFQEQSWTTVRAWRMSIVQQSQGSDHLRTSSIPIASLMYPHDRLLHSEREDGASERLCMGEIEEAIHAQCSSELSAALFIAILSAHVTSAPLLWSCSTRPRHLLLSYPNTSKNRWNIQVRSDSFGQQ